MRPRLTVVGWAGFYKGKMAKIVHQIFYDFYGSGMNQLFQDSAKRFRAWAEGNGYEYMLWSEEDCGKLMEEYADYADMYTFARYPIMQVDIARLCILHKMGGLYADLDVFPQLDKMKFCDFALAVDKTSKGQKKKGAVTNEIMQSSKGSPVLIGFLDYIKSQIKEKENISVYKERKARFVLHTTGPYALHRFLKLNNINCERYTTNQLEFGKAWKYKGLGNTHGVDFICHHSLSWYECLNQKPL